MTSLTRRSLLLSTSVAPAMAAAPAGAEARRLPAATVAARTKFFGAANVDGRGRGRVRRDRVILSWFGCTSFAASFAGQVVLLDAWIPRGPYSGRVPTSLQEVADLAPSHIFVGHGHFDHAADAAPLAAASGAEVVGTREHCAQVRRQAGRSAVRVGPLALSTPGDRADLVIGRMRVEATLHLHSAVKPPSGDEPPLVTVPDPAPVLSHPPEPGDAVDTLSHQTDEEGGSVIYRFEVGGFSMLWHDTAGPLRDDAPALLASLARQSRPDVQVGAVQGFGQYSNGLRDPMDYVEAARPRVFVPCHHDNWLPGLSTSASSYEGRLRSAIADIPAAARPRLLFIKDPVDYVDPRPLTFAL